MPSERDLTFWRDIADNCRRALRFGEGLDEAALQSDDRTYYALIRCLEVISEAARRLTPEARKAADLPWKQIMGSGNVYRHDYDLVTPPRVWKTVTEDLPGLLAAAEAALKE